MESLSAFIKEVYIAKPDSRITVKDIYEDFREWIIGKYDMKMWNKISQRQVYAELKVLPEYPYVRFKEGYCLKGISYRREKSGQETQEVKTVQYLTLNIVEGPRPTAQLNTAIIKPRNVESPVTIGQNEGIKGNYICPRIQGVILPTLGQKAK